MTRTLALLAFLSASLLLLGCISSTVYVCADGREVSDKALCGQPAPADNASAIASPSPSPAGLFDFIPSAAEDVQVKALAANASRYVGKNVTVSGRITLGSVDPYASGSKAWYALADRQQYVANALLKEESSRTLPAKNTGQILRVTGQFTALDACMCDGTSLRATSACAEPLSEGCNSTRTVFYFVNTSSWELV